MMAGRGQSLDSLLEQWQHRSEIKHYAYSLKGLSIARCCILPDMLIYSKLAIVCFALDRPRIYSSVLFSGLG